MSAVPSDTRSPARGVVVVVVVILLVLAEAMARVRGDRICAETPGAFHVADRALGWIHPPGLRGRIGSCADATAPPMLIEANSRGLLDLERSYGKPAGVRRIVLIGGSYAEGLGVRREQTVARSIEGLVDADRGARVEVINASVGGWALDNALQFLRLEGGKYQPDLVLVFVKASWDLVAIWPPLLHALGARAAAKPYFRPNGEQLVGPEWPVTIAAGADPPLVRSGLDHVALYRQLRDRPAWLGPPVDRVDPAQWPSGGLARDRATARDLAANLLRALQSETATRGVPLVVVLTPDEVNSNPAATEFLQLTHMLAIPTVDLRGEFARLERVEAGWLLGHRYWDAAGHVSAARTVMRFLITNGLLPAGIVPGAGARGVVLPSALRVGDVRAWLWGVREAAQTWVLLCGAMAAGLLWLGGLLPRRWGDGWCALVGLTLLGSVTAPRVAWACAGLAALWWVLVESVPRPARRFLLLVAAVGWVGGSVAMAAWQWVPADDYLGRQLLAIATGVLFLRLLSYAVDRERHAAALPLPSFLGAVFFAPTLLAGPMFAAIPLARARIRVQPPGLRRVLCGIGFAAAALGVLLVAPEFLCRTSGIVMAGRGAEVDRFRLWLWVFEPGALALATLWGWTTLGRAQAMWVGLPLPPDVRAPWRAVHVSAFWSRWWTSLARWMHVYVYVPAGGTERRVVSTLAAFLAAGAWCAWMSVTLFGIVHLLDRPILGALSWAALNAALCLAVPPLGTGAGRWLRLAGLVILIALASLPLLTQPMGGLPQVVDIWRRLVGWR